MTTNQTQEQPKETIFSQIDAIFASHTKTREDLQNVLIECAIRISQAPHNPGFIVYLVTKIEQDGGGMRCEDVIKWLNEFASVEIKYSVADKKHKVAHKEFPKEQAVERLNKGKATPWFKLTKPVKDTEWDIDKAVNLVLSQHSKLAKQRTELLKDGKADKAELIHLNSEKARAIKALQADPRLIAMVNREFYKVIETVPAEAAEALVVNA